MPTLDRITVYPIKSLDGLSTTTAHLQANGSLALDRRWAIVDEAGRFINGKRSSVVHGWRMEFKPQRLGVLLNDGEEVAEFDLGEDLDELERWLGIRVGQRVRIVENKDSGFPDDTDAPGPTIISTATLQTVASWFPGLTLPEVRRRFRANLEIGGVEPFWEDRLYGEQGERIRFRIGNIILAGVNPCQRCAVPSRDSQTGEVWPEFAKRFAQQRAATLPDWANRARFNHFYRLAVNTCPAGDFISGEIQVGDEVTIG